MKGYECKMCPHITQMFLVNMNGAKGRLGGKKSQAHLTFFLYTPIPYFSDIPKIREFY
jgi:hypothetical protein